MSSGSRFGTPIDAAHPFGLCIFRLTRSGADCMLGVNVDYPSKGQRRSLR